MFKPRLKRDPYCPRCLYGLRITFVGRGHIQCPECGINVTEYQASYVLSRLKFLLGAIGLVLILPSILSVLTNLMMKVQIDDPLFNYKPGLFCLLTATYISQASAPLYLGYTVRKEWLHLGGSNRKPSGRTLILILVVSWVLTTIWIIWMSVMYAKHNQTIF